MRKVGKSVEDVNARVIARCTLQRNHNPTTSINYFSSKKFAMKTWNINSSSYVVNIM
jgi:hypothetical protein